MGRRGGSVLRGQDKALGSLCYATETTGGILTAFTAEEAYGEVGVSLPSLQHQQRTVISLAFCPMPRLQSRSLSRL